MEHPGSKELRDCCLLLVHLPRYLHLLWSPLPVSSVYRWYIIMYPLLVLYIPRRPFFIDNIFWRVEISFFFDSSKTNVHMILDFSVALLGASIKSGVSQKNKSSLPNKPNERTNERVVRSLVWFKSVYGKPANQWEWMNTTPSPTRVQPQLARAGTL